MPNYLNLDGDMILCSGARTHGWALQRAAHGRRAGSVLFRSRELGYSHRDIPKQKQLLRATYAGMGGEVPRLMAELDRTPAFYFDSITQIHMNTWSRGRVTLVGDAGY